jgi:hypothetical protein
MTAKEISSFVKEMKKNAQKVSSSAAASRKFLSKTGIYTKTGKLKKQYQ